MERLVVLGLIFSFGCVAHSKHWGYFDTAETYSQKDWAKNFPDCGKTSQSPILLDAKKCKATSFKPLKFKSLIQILNNGHSAQVNVNQQRRVVMSGGPLKNDYIVEQFHFHWGSNASVKKGLGTEHHIRGLPASLEMHIVTYDSTYKTMKEAASKPNGLSVFGVLFKVATEDDESVTIGDIMAKKAMSKIVKAESKEMEEAPAVHKLLKLLKKSGVTESYFKYQGSLTTPPCSETVLWMVSKKTLSVSPCTLNRFQSLKDTAGKPLQDNFRFIQKLNDRVVLCN